MARSFHDLVVFQRAIDLVVAIYEATASFPDRERFGLTKQLRGSALGVSAQIAEGAGRLSFGEFRQFLSQARGSLYEVEAECLVAVKLQLLQPGSHEELKRHIARTASALAGLIKWVKKKEADAKRPGNRATRQPGN